jgi:flagellar motor switch protein FliN/FliY
MEPMSDTTLLEERTAEIPASPRGIDRLLGLEIPVTVCFGSREIALKDLATLGPGSIVELDRGAAAPVDLLVNGQVVARGDLLLLDDHYALRVTEVVSTGDRIRSLGRSELVGG